MDHFLLEDGNLSQEQIETSILNDCGQVFSAMPRRKACSMGQRYRHFQICPKSQGKSLRSSYEFYNIQNS